MLSNSISEGGWNKKVSLQNWKLLRAQHLNWTSASKRGRLSRSALAWAFSPDIRDVQKLWKCWNNNLNNGRFYEEKGNRWSKKDFQKLSLLLSQNIKKKEAGGAKSRPMGGGLLPPPPGAKAGGFIPPPVAQQTVSPVQTNTGDHHAFVSNTNLKTSSHFPNGIHFVPSFFFFFLPPDPVPLLDFGSSVPAAQPTSSDMWGDFTSAGSK